MAINKPVKRGTRQTEERARGLVGWKNGRQVTTSKDSVANKSVGDYKARKGRSGKTLNLTSKQLGASGRRAASAATVDISKTTFDKSKGGVLGPMGKPLTGRVDLGGGNIAVYRNGVRVRASSKPSGGGGNGGGGGGGGNGGGGYVMPKRDATKAGQGTPMRPVAPRKPPGAKANLSPRQIAAARRGEAADKRKGGNTRSGMSAATIRAVGKPASISQGAPSKSGTASQQYMNAPYRSGKTKPLPGITAAERKYNNSDKARAYPSRASNQQSNEIARNSLIMASILAGGFAGGLPAAGVGLGGRALAAGAVRAGASRTASRATQWGRGVAVESKVPVRGAPRVNSNLSPTGPGRSAVPNKKIGPTTTSRDTQWGKGVAVVRRGAKELTPAQKGARTRAANASKKKG